MKAPLPFFPTVLLSRSPSEKTEKFSGETESFLRTDDICIGLTTKNDDIFLIELQKGQPTWPVDIEIKGKYMRRVGEPLIKYLSFKERLRLMSMSYERFRHVDASPSFAIKMVGNAYAVHNVGEILSRCAYFRKRGS